MTFMQIFRRSHRAPEPDLPDFLVPHSREQFVGSGLVKTPRHPYAAFHAPADIGRDLSLDRAERIRLLSKWRDIASERYHETGAIEHLDEVHATDRVLTALQQHRNDY